MVWEFRGLWLRVEALRLGGLAGFRFRGVRASTTPRHDGPFSMVTWSRGCHSFIRPYMA